PLAVVEDLVCAPERAGERAAHPDLVLADWFLVEQCIERDDALDVRGREVEAPRDEVDDFVAHPPVLILAQMERGDERARSRRVLRQKIRQLALAVGG